MTLKQGRKPSLPIESLALYAEFLEPSEQLGATSSAVKDPKAFLSEVETALTESLANPSRLYGWHVQGLFEAVVVALGKVRLLKVEDSGRFYYDDTTEVKLPDFRIVTSFGEQILVEV
jgi:hypothetical protein